MHDGANNPQKGRRLHRLDIKNGVVWFKTVQVVSRILCYPLRAISNG
jgi:hypothetical protein